MRNSTVQILFYIALTVISAAMQDMLPSVFGIKPPVMLAVALSFALHEVDVSSVSRSRVSKSFGFIWMVYAFIMGSTSDALGCLPIGCDAGFFLLACLILRMIGNYVRDTPRFTLSLISLLVVVPLHETWMSAWGVVGVGTSNPFHSLLSIFPSLITGLIIFSIMPLLEKWAGLDRNSQEVLV